MTRQARRTEPPLTAAPAGPTKATGGRSTTGLIDAPVSARANLLRPSIGPRKAYRTNGARTLASLRRRVAAEVSRIFGYADLATSARYLGVSSAQLRTELQSGHSLA
ncbi:MAG: hypothetical protein ACLQBY_10625 [Solirubrobacteraceae bacterium]